MPIRRTAEHKRNPPSPPLTRLKSYRYPGVVASRVSDARRWDHHSMATGEASQSTPSMPARNRWLADSVYPTSHFNPGATDSVLSAGPAVGQKLTRNQDVKSVTNVFVSNPAVKKIESDTVGFASGTLGVLKVRLTGGDLDA